MWGAKTSAAICDKLRKRVKETGATDPTQITGDLQEIIVGMMDGDSSLKLDTTPSVILVIGGQRGGEKPPPSANWRPI